MLKVRKNKGKCRQTSLIPSFDFNSFPNSSQPSWKFLPSAFYTLQKYCLHRSAWDTVSFQNLWLVDYFLRVYFLERVSYWDVLRLLNRFDASKSLALSFLRLLLLLTHLKPTKLSNFNQHLQASSYFNVNSPLSLFATTFLLEPRQGPRRHDGWFFSGPISPALEANIVAPYESSASMRGTWICPPPSRVPCAPCLGLFNVYFCDNSAISEATHWLGTPSRFLALTARKTRLHLSVHLSSNLSVAYRVAKPYNCRSSCSWGRSRLLSKLK